MLLKAVREVYTARIYLKDGRGSSLLAAGCNITDVRLARGPAQKLLSHRPTADTLHANGLLFLSDNRYGLDPWAASQASQLRTLSQEQWGSGAAHDGWLQQNLSWRPHGETDLRASLLACLRACCVSVLMSCDQ